MKSMAAALIMVFGLTLSGVQVFKGQDIEVSMVSKSEASYLLASGITTIPQSGKVITVDYNGKQYTVVDSNLYDGFTEGKKVKVSLDNIF